MNATELIDLLRNLPEELKENTIFCGDSKDICKPVNSIYGETVNTSSISGPNGMKLYLSAGQHGSIEDNMTDIRKDMTELRNRIDTIREWERTELRMLICSHSPRWFDDNNLFSYIKLHQGFNIYDDFSTVLKSMDAAKIQKYVSEYEKLFNTVNIGQINDRMKHDENNFTPFNLVFSDGMEKRVNGYVQVKRFNATYDEEYDHIVFWAEDLWTPLEREVKGHKTYRIKSIFKWWKTLMR